MTPSRNISTAENSENILSITERLQLSLLQYDRKKSFQSIYVSEGNEHPVL